MATPFGLGRSRRPVWARPGHRLVPRLDRPPGAGLPWLLDGVRAVLEGIAAVVSCDPGRLLPLVVVPVLGIGAGGFGDDRGAAIRGLLAVADDVCYVVAIGPARRGRPRVISPG